MASRLNPYLNYRNQAREVMEFYKSVFGGELTVNTFGEYQMTQDPSEKDKVMHSQLETPAGFTLMASDVPMSMPLNESNHPTISLSGDDEAELRGYWQKLAEGGRVAMELTKAEWGDTFGMLSDKYGTSWMVNISGQH